MTWFLFAFPIALALLGVKHLLWCHPIVARYTVVINLLLFGTVLSLPAAHFWQKGNRAGVIAVSLCGIALGKFLHDAQCPPKSQSDESEETA